MRTTAAQVEAVLQDNWDGETSVSPFMEAATVIVDRVEAMAVRRGRTLTAAELELVERWLSAHFYARVDKTYQSKSTGGSSASFTGQTGMSLDSTEYGQTAVNIDWSGSLDAIGRRNFARAAWLGVDRCNTGTAT